MFGSCESLNSIELSNFDTSHVDDMGYLFNYCIYLKSIDLSTFDTRSLVQADFMFRTCVSLESINLSNLNSNQKLQNMSHIFYNFNSIKYLNLSTFPTYNVNNMENIFNG